jgi:hypothetical protein
MTWNASSIPDVVPRFLLPVVALCLVVSAAPARSLDRVVDVGQPVPEFSLPGLDGDSVSFEGNIRGKAPLTILFFMTTACSACYEELQELSDFVKRNPNKVAVWCVAVNSPFQGSSGSTILPRSQSWMGMGWCFTKRADIPQTRTSTI